MLHISGNIALIRLLAEKTQPEFAELFTNSSTAKIKSYEGGRAKPSELFIQELAEFACVSEEDLKNKQLKKPDLRILAEKVEKDKKISHENILNDTDPPLYKKTFGEAPTPMEAYVASLKSELKRADETIALLKESNDNLKMQLQQSIKKLDTNFETSLKNQEELLANLKAGLQAAARRFAGNDKKKLQQELEWLYNAAGAALGQDAYTDIKDGK